MKILISLFFGFLFTGLYSQRPYSSWAPEYKITDSDPDIFTNIQFNLKKINPAISADTSIFSTGIVHQRQWLGPANAINGSSIILESRIPKIAGGIGLQADFFGNRDIRKQSVEFFYDCRVLNRNNWKINVGAGFGFTQHKTELIYLQFDHTYNLIDQINFKSWETDIGALVSWKNHQISLAYNNYLINTDLVDGYPGVKPRDALAQFTVGYLYSIRLTRKLYLEPELFYFELKRKEMLALNTNLVINHSIRTGFYLDMIIPGIYYDFATRYGLHFSCLLWHFLELGYAAYYEQIEDSQWGGNHIFKAGVKISGH